MRPRLCLAWPRVDDLYRLLAVGYATVASSAATLRRSSSRSGAGASPTRAPSRRLPSRVRRDAPRRRAGPGPGPGGGPPPARGRAFLLFSAIFLSVVADRMVRLRVAAATDPLTGLPNRTGLFERIALELARSKRTGRPVAVAVLDLDRFKDFNDAHGHLAGDRLLIAVGEALVGRPQDDGPRRPVRRRGVRHPPPRDRTRGGRGLRRAHPARHLESARAGDRRVRHGVDRARRARPAGRTAAGRRGAPARGRRGPLSRQGPRKGPRVHGRRTGRGGAPSSHQRRIGVTMGAP